MLLRLIRDAHAHPNQPVTGQLYLVSEFPLPFMGEQVRTHQVQGYPLDATSELPDRLLPELFYPVSLTHRYKSGQLLPTIQSIPGRGSDKIAAGLRKGAIYLSREDLCALVTMISDAIAIGEEVRLEITHFEPEYPDYPYIDYNPRVHGMEFQSETKFVNEES